MAEVVPHLAVCDHAGDAPLSTVTSSAGQDVVASGPSVVDKVSAYCFSAEWGDFALALWWDVSEFFITGSLRIDRRVCDA